jgi:acyl-CoA thioester hydrolase
MYRTMIFYQDTDAGGVVYFANYLKFFEKSWFGYLMSIGISIPEWQEKDVCIMVKTVFMDLIAKLQYGDVIDVVTSLKDLRNSYFLLEHTVSRNGGATTRGETKMVCVDSSGKLRRIPEELKMRLQKALEEERPQS